MKNSVGLIRIQIGTLALLALTGCTSSLKLSGVLTSGSSAASTAAIPTVTLSLDKSSIASGDSAVLTWSSINATSCVASGAWSGAKSPVGSVVLTPTQTSTYSISCSNGIGSSVQSIIVTVTTTSPGPSPTPIPVGSVSLSANPTSILTAASSKLTWSTANVSSCKGSGGSGSDGWAGAQSASGTLSISPTSSTTYTLTCLDGNSNPVSQSVTVSVTSVASPMTTISLNPTSITTGATATLIWSSTNATSCAASGSWSGSQSLSGSTTVNSTAVGTFTYTITCTGAGGSSSQSAKLTVNQPTAGGTLPTGPNFNFTSAPALSTITVIPNRDSVILNLPAVPNARDFRVLVQPTSVSANSNGTESVAGGTIFCAGLRQHQARARFLSDDKTNFPYYYNYLSGPIAPVSYGGYTDIDNPVPQGSTASWHDLDTPPNLRLEITGLTSSMTVTVEAIDRLCPFPGSIGQVHQDIQAIGPDLTDHVGNPYLDASKIGTFPIVTKAEVVAKYGSLIINGQGAAGGPNVQANPPANMLFGQPAPVNPPVVLARSAVVVAPMSTPPAPLAAFFDDFSNTNDPLVAVTTAPKWTYPRWDGGITIKQNSKWSVYGVGFTDQNTNNIGVAYGTGFMDAFMDGGMMHTQIADRAQDVFSEVGMFPRKAAHLNSTTYLHVTYEVPSFATGRRYWAVTLCGSSTPGQTLDSNGLLKEQVVHTTFFYVNNGASPSTAGWNCLQIFNREGNSNAEAGPFGWENMYNLNGSRPPIPPNKGAYDIADYIYNSIYSIPNPTQVAGYTKHPESDVMVLVNKPIPAAGLPEVFVGNELVAVGPYTSPINVSPYQLDNAVQERAWFYRVDGNGNPVEGILDDQQQSSPRTKYDLYIRNNRIIMYANGQAKLCNDFTTPTTTLNIADAAVGFHDILYHSGGEFVERLNNPDRGGAFHYRYNSPFMDERSWDNIGFEESVSAPSDFNPATCFVHTSLGAENNEP